MDEPNLVAICGLAFLTVFTLLAVLSIAMRGLTALFPATPEPARPAAAPAPLPSGESTTGVDPAVAAAIASTVAALSPEARVTRIEELPC